MPEPMTLQVVTGNEAGILITVPASGAVLGRSTGCDIKLGDPTLSRKHCRITREDAEWVIQDLGSRGGVVINGQKKNSSPLKQGDTIKLGDVTLMVISPPGPHAVPWSSTAAPTESAGNPVPESPFAEPVQPPASSVAAHSSSVSRKLIVISGSVALAAVLLGVAGLYLHRQVPRTAVEPPAKAEPVPVAEAPAVKAEEAVTAKPVEAAAATTSPAVDPGPSTLPSNSIWEKWLLDGDVMSQSVCCKDNAALQAHLDACSALITDETMEHAATLLGDRTKAFTCLWFAAFYFAHDSEGGLNPMASKTAFTAAILNITKDRLDKAKGLAQSSQPQPQDAFVTLEALGAACGSFVHRPGEFDAAAFNAALGNLNAALVQKAASQVLESGPSGQKPTLILRHLLAVAGGFPDASGGGFNAASFNSRLTDTVATPFAGDQEARLREFYKRMKP